MGARRGRRDEGPDVDGGTTDPGVIAILVNHLPSGATLPADGQLYWEFPSEEWRLSIVDLDTRTAIPLDGIRPAASQRASTSASTARSAPRSSTSPAVASAGFHTMPESELSSGGRSASVPTSAAAMPPSSPQPDATESQERRAMNGVREGATAGACCR